MCTEVVRLTYTPGGKSFNELVELPGMQRTHCDVTLKPSFPQKFHHIELHPKNGVSSRDQFGKVKIRRRRVVHITFSLAFPGTSQNTVALTRTTLMKLFPVIGCRCRYPLSFFYSNSLAYVSVWLLLFRVLRDVSRLK